MAESQTTFIDYFGKNPSNNILNSNYLTFNSVFSLNKLPYILYENLINFLLSISINQRSLSPKWTVLEKN